MSESKDTNSGTGNSWTHWDEELEKFRKAEDISMPATTHRHWQRFLLYIFMPALLRNVLNKNETFDSIIARIIEAIQVACGFKRVRFYRARKLDDANMMLKLESTTKGNEAVDKIKGKNALKIKKGLDDAVNTLFTRRPLVTEDARSLNLKYKNTLRLSGPYVAIPLFFRTSPIGLICADTVVPESVMSSEKIGHPEYKEHFLTFAYSVIAAIEQFNMLHQSDKEIRQLEMIKGFNELIQSKTDPKDLLRAFVEHGGRQVNADGGHLKIVSKKTGELERVADYGDHLAPIDLKFKPKDIGFSNWVFNNREPLIVNDVAAHPIMKQKLEYWKQEKGGGEYLVALKSRKSSLLVPLQRRDGEVFGVLDLHGKSKDQFSDRDKENLLALTSSVIYAIDKAEQLERQNKLIEAREKILKMLHKAVENAQDLPSVLGIIRDSFHELEIFKDVEKNCLALKDPQQDRLIPPIVKCFKPQKQDCTMCMDENPLFNEAFKTKERHIVGNELVLPILRANQSIGVFYIKTRENIEITEDIDELLDVITNTAAILILMSLDYGEKIKQAKALWEAGQINVKSKGFEEWFNPIMEKVLDIIGREKRNFHLVIVEQIDNKPKLVIRATSPIKYDDKEIKTDYLIDKILDLDNSLAGRVVKTRETQIIGNVAKNKKLPYGSPAWMPYHEYNADINSEVGIPLKKIVDGQEKVLGVCIIDSMNTNDFRKLDLTFYETVANYLATTIHNQNLYENSLRMQEEQERTDSARALSVVLDSFFDDIIGPASELNHVINLIEMTINDPKAKKFIEKASEESQRLLDIHKDFVHKFASRVSKRENVELRGLITDTLSTIERTKELGVTVKGNYKETDLKLFCHPALLELAVRSILSHAVMFSKNLRPKSDRYLSIDVELDQEKKWVTVILESSTSEHIPEDKLNLIFKPFQNVISNWGRAGLGLSLAELSIKFHGGKIHVENISGSPEAIRFEISLPRGREFVTPKILGV